jgi:hypothetical protein
VLLERHVRPDLSTAIDGVRICKVHPSAPPVSSSSGTVLAMIAQGAKRLAFGDRVYEYRAGQYLVASIDLPVTGEFLDTGSDEPALGFGMALEPSAVTELLLEVGSGVLPEPSAAVRPGITVSDASEDLLDAVVRLLRLLDSPWDRKALVPAFKREVLWRLITGDQGDAVRQLGLADSRLNQITRAVRWIRENYTRSFRVEELAHLDDKLADDARRVRPVGLGDQRGPVPAVPRPQECGTTPWPASCGRPRRPPGSGPGGRPPARRERGPAARGRRSRGRWRPPRCAERVPGPGRRERRPLPRGR